ncbi:sugar transferase [candidate division KSB1 bacterium]|nr:sugar transferase [candidate division KSB1 bacterium]
MKRILFKFLDYFHKLLLFSADGIVVIFSFWLAHQLWMLTPQRLNTSYIPFQPKHVFLFAFLFNAIMIWGQTYKIQSSVVHVVRLKNLIKYCMIGFVMALVVGFFTKSLLIGRLQAIYTFLILIPLLIAERGIADGLWNWLITQRIQKKRIVIFGAGNTGKRLVKAIEKHPKLGYYSIGFFDDRKSSESVVMANPLPVMGGKDEFLDFLKKRKHEIDEVLIAMPSASTQEVMHLMKMCDDYKLPYKFVPGFNELALHRLNQEQLDGIPLFSSKELYIPLWDRILKRGLDVVVSISILIITAPILGIISLLLKKGSEGSVLFKQKRVGLNGQEFKMYKFRTMYVDTPRYAEHPQEKEDPRITRIGRYLRRTSLDEMPQFWNVLKGEMSVVGPRPEMPFIVEKYNDMHRERLKVKPGITGIWQISGDRSLPIHENMDHDLYYIEHQSLLLDIVIVFQTIYFALIRGIGAR